MHHPLKQRGQLSFEGLKQLIQPLLAHIGLKRLGQDFPGAAAGWLSGSQLRCLLLAQADQLLQRRGERGEIIAAASFLPHRIAMGLSPGEGFDQGGIQAAGAFQLQSQQLQVALTFHRGISRLLSLGGLKQLDVLNTGLALVQLSGHQGELLTTPGGCRGRHHRVLIEVERAADGTQQPGLLEVIPQRLQRCHPQASGRASAKILARISPAPWERSNSASLIPIGSGSS